MNKSKKAQNKTHALSIIYYVVLVALTSLGFVINKHTVATLISAVLFLALVAFLLFMRPRLATKKANEKTRIWRFFEKHALIKFWAIIFLSWMPCLLAYYPVLFNYDVMRQMPEVLSGQYSVFHPISHTLMLGLFFKIGKLLNSVNVGFFLYSIVQILFLSFSMAFALNTLNRMKVKKRYILFTLIFYSIALFSLVYS